VECPPGEVTVMLSRANSGDQDGPGRVDPPPPGDLRASGRMARDHRSGQRRQPPQRIRAVASSYHRYFRGLSVDQAAEALSVSSRTVKCEWVLVKGSLHAELSAGGLQ